MGKFKDSAITFIKTAILRPRVIGVIVVVAIVVWALCALFGSPDQPMPPAGSGHQADSHAVAPAAPAVAPPAASAHDDTQTVVTGSAGQQAESTTSHGAAGIHENAADSPQPHAAETHAAAPAAVQQHAATQDNTGHAVATTTPVVPHPAPVIAPVVHKPTPRGVAFVEAAIRPMEYELEERWWGWRPNDIISPTDNVENFQLGVLEITRRTVVALAEKISRHGVTDALDPDLEEAMNWFMVKASSYWFPSAESKYKDGLDELRTYLENLREGKATFFIRSDNLIPLLASFEDLLGSCDENLVKDTNEDGTPVSFFKADNYFYYTQGVSSAMAEVLEAVHHDFLLTLESRNATELLHHAIVSLQRAADMRPWIILDSDLDSLFANNRANMAAPISHARFYLGQLVKTLST